MCICNSIYEYFKNNITNFNDYNDKYFEKNINKGL